VHCFTCRLDGKGPGKALGSGAGQVGFPLDDGHRKSGDDETDAELPWPLRPENAAPGEC
jgi:hypothetical protein